MPSKAGYTVESVNENSGSQLNAASGVYCQPAIVYSPEEVPATSAMAWLRARCRDYARENGIIGEHECPCLGNDVNVQTGGIKSVVHHQGSDIKNNLIAVIPDMLKNAVLVQTERNGHSKSHILAAKVRYGESERYVCGMVIHENNGEYYYDHELMEIEDADPRSLRFNSRPGSRESASVMNIIRKVISASGFDKKDKRNTTFSLSDQSGEYSPAPDGEPPRLISAAYSPMQQEQIVKMLKPVMEGEMEGDSRALAEYLEICGVKLAREEDALYFARLARPWMDAPWPPPWPTTGSIPPRSSPGQRRMHGIGASSSPQDTPQPRPGPPGPGSGSLEDGIGRLFPFKNGDKMPSQNIQ